MAQVGTNEFKPGIKIEFEGQPHTIVTNEFVKPGKGQAFNRVRLRHLMTGRVVEKNIKSGEKFDIADVLETWMRYLYSEADGLVFMDETSFEQIKIPNEIVGNGMQWMKEDVVYDILFYKGNPIGVEPPTFMELKITETSPGARGDTSGRVLKLAITETGAKVQVPIFIEENEVIKVDTRTGDYVSRV